MQNLIPEKIRWTYQIMKNYKLQWFNLWNQHNEIKVLVEAREVLGTDAENQF